MKGKVAIVTGAASGIGAATVERLAADGATVLAFDLAPCPARERVWPIAGDVTRQADVDRLIAEAQKLGALHVVVNAAGVVAADDPEHVEDATWERMLAINLSGTMRLCRAAIPLLKAAGGGAIVNVASVAAFNASPGSASYAPSKAGVVAYTRNLGFSLGADHIRANCLCPGWTHTAMAEAELREAAAKAGTSFEHELHALASGLALRRLATPAEMAACIRFLAGDDASFVTGAVLVADGGGRMPAVARGV